MRQSKGWGMRLDFKFCTHRCVLFSSVWPSPLSYALTQCRCPFAHSYPLNILFKTSIHISALIKMLCHFPFSDLISSNIRIITPNAYISHILTYRFKHYLHTNALLIFHVLPLPTFSLKTNCFTFSHTGHRAPPDTQIQRRSDVRWWVEERTPGEEDGPPGLFCRGHVCVGRWRLSGRQGRTLPAAGSWDCTHLPRVLWQDRWGGHI